jgi:uncharacterized protein YraI
MSLLKPLAAAAAIIAMSAGVAAAAPAVSETDLNMRSGPGTDHAVVDVIPAGATVGVLDCAGTWCRVAYAGATGYASRSYLAMGAGGVTVGRAYTPAPTVVYEDYDYGSADPYYYTYGPSVGIGVDVRPDWRYQRRWRERDWVARDPAWRGASGGVAVQGPTVREGAVVGGRVSGNVGGGVRTGGTAAVRTGGGVEGGARAGAGAAVRGGAAVNEPTAGAGPSGGATMQNR